MQRHEEDRKRWHIAMKRDERKNNALLETSVRNVCQGNFDANIFVYCI